MSSKPRLTIVAVVATATLAGACGGTQRATPAAVTTGKPAAFTQPKAPGGRIAFRRYLDAARARGAIFTIKPDGTGERQVTDPPPGHSDDQPDWSPDGKQIAFQRCADGAPCEVLIVPANGGAARKLKGRCALTPKWCDLASPAWTPDGRLVVTLYQGEIRAQKGGEEWIQQAQLELFDLRKHTQRTILARRNWTGEPSTPAVSPDGRTILYARYNSPRTDPANGRALYAVNLDGSHNHQVASWALGGGDHAGFAPNGTVLFRSHEDDGSKQSDYWTVRLDGSNLKQLTHFKNGTLVTSASYSPDGRWIVHATDGVGGVADVFIMRADGTGNRPVTRTEAWDSAPDWSPAG